jgi:YD repeat-containing protein
VQKYWYSVWPFGDPSPNGYVYKEYALPIKHHQVKDGTFLSTETFSESGTILRSSYLRFEYDAIGCTGPESETYGLSSKCLDSNRRPAEEITVFHDDGSRSSRTVHSDFDGFGHYRKSLHTSDFEGTPERTEFTNYAPDQTSWLLEKFTDSWVKQGSGSRAIATKKIAVFDSTLGVMKSLRALTAKGSDPDGLATSSHDLLTAWCRDSRGFLSSERSFGGDTGTVPVGDPCLETWAAERYFLNHTYTPDGAGNTIHRAQYSGVADLLVDEVWDAKTRAVLKSRDSAGVAADYTYDQSGRVKSARPTGQAWAEYEYLPTSNPPTITVRQCPNGVSNCTANALTEARSYFDSLGRLTQSLQKTSATTWASTWTTYDALGRVSTNSVPVFVSSSAASAEPPGTTHAVWTYDALGRVTQIVLPDNSTTTFAYVGSRTKTRSSGIWTVTNGAQDTQVPVTEQYDGFGRLIAVTEKSGPTTASSRVGALITTEYEYDPADRLSAVTMNRSGTAQHRLFDYDGRGFLRWESQPESGVTSFEYDARGHVRSKNQGAANTLFDLKYSYDSAERLLRVEGRNPLYDPSNPSPFEPAFHVLKEFAYADSNNGNDLRMGKVSNAVRYNYPPPLTGSDTYRIEDLYRYRDAAGRRTERTTTIARGNNNLGEIPVRILLMQMSYDDLGLPLEVEYPKCFDCGLPPQDPDRRNVTRSYEYGRLKSMISVKDLQTWPIVTEITYWPNGMQNVLSHGNSIADTQTVGDMPRPASLKFATYHPCIRPSFPTQPVSMPASGGSATLTAVLSGTSPFHYEWWNLTDNEVAGSGMTLDGQTTVSLPLENLTANKTYQLTVANACGYEVSESAIVSISGCESPSTGQVRAVIQPDGSWVLKPDPVSRKTQRTYAWRRLPSPAVIGSAETLAVSALTETTTFSFTIADECGSASSNVTITIPLTITSTGLVATATSPASVTVTWPAVSGATLYHIGRRSGSGWEEVGTTSQASFIDTTVAPSRTYAYRVYAQGNGNTSPFSNSDVATTRSFSAPVSGQIVTTTPSTDMLDAVNSVRAALGWPALTWANILAASDPVPASGSSVTARQILSCRARMNEALQALGAPVQGYTDGDVTLQAIKALHIREVQERAQ